MADVPLDTSHLVETPEGIDLLAQVAGPVPRALAYALDLGLRTMILVAVSSVLFFAGDFGLGAITLIAFVLEWLYPVFFEIAWDGQTPGKRQLGLAVVCEDLGPLDWSRSLLRNLMRAADFLPAVYVAGLVAMVSNARFQRLGDLVAGTLVVHRPGVGAAAELPVATPCAPPIHLELDEQLAVVALAQRHRRLSLDRQRELADILGPELHASGDAALARLHGMARWLMGER